MNTGFDPTVYRSKAVSMQRLMLAIAQGYTHWVGGQVEAERAMPMAEKFTQLYHCGRTTQQRYRSKLTGQANTRLFLFPLMDSTRLAWWLLRTPGTLEHGDREQWGDATCKRGRLLWLDEYELVRLPYTQALARQYAQADITRVEGWTWRMQADCYQAWRTRLRKSVAAEKHGNHTLTRQAIYALENAPGFRGVRAQVWELRDYFNRCRHASGLPQHEFSAAPRWMRARRCREFPLSRLVANQRRGAKSWFE